MPAFLDAAASFSFYFSAFTCSLYLFFSSSVKLDPYIRSLAAFSAFVSSIGLIFSVA